MPIELQIYTYGTLFLLAVALAWFIASDLIGKWRPYYYANVIRKQDKTIKEQRHELQRYKAKYGKLPEEGSHDA